MDSVFYSVSHGGRDDRDPRGKQMDERRSNRVRSSETERIKERGIFDGLSNREGEEGRGLLLFILKKGAKIKNERRKKSNYKILENSVRYAADATSCSVRVARYVSTCRFGSIFDHHQKTSLGR